MHRKLVKLFNCAVSSVNPGHLIRSKVRLDSIKNQVFVCDKKFNANSKYHVIGFGKAVLGMASTLQEILQHRIVSGVLSVPVGSPECEFSKIKVFAGAPNNLPDENSIKATEEILELARVVPVEDIVIVLISGGGSSLLCKPVPGISLEDKLLTVKLLVASGADIRELNTVRKSLSQVKGGGLGKLLGRRNTICLILSDVVGDPLDVIASGPTVPNSDADLAALEVIQKYRLELKVPKHVLGIIQRHKSISSLEDGYIKNEIIGSNNIALGSVLENDPTTPSCKKILVSSSVEGFITDVADSYFKLTTQILRFLHTKDSSEFFANLRLWVRESSNFNVGHSFLPNLTSAFADSETDCAILLMGGETTVRVSGSGLGGRNQELAVLFAQLLHNLLGKEPELFSQWGVCILCAGTDGIDGPTDAAGAIGCPELIQTGIDQGLDVEHFLNNNDSYSYLSAVADGEFLVKTGHTGTNVMDIHLLAVYKKTAFK